jgi:hypothetical protein
VRCVATHRLRSAQVGSAVSLRAAAMSAGRSALPKGAVEFGHDWSPSGASNAEDDRPAEDARAIRVADERGTDEKLASIRPLYWNGTHPSVFEFPVEKERDHDFDAAGASI